MGWVFFQAGNCEFPVWMGSNIGAAVDDSGDGASIFITRDYRWVNQTTATDPGAGRVKVNNLDPNLATAVYLSAYDLASTAFLTLLSLTTNDLLAIYLSGDVTTRIEYKISGPPTNNTAWFLIPVTVSANHGFAPGTPGNNNAVKVTVQTTDTVTPPPSAWAPVTFQNGWVNFDAGRTAQYRKNGDYVELRGVVKSGTVAYGTAMFTLPVGYRPLSSRGEIDFVCLSAPNASAGVAVFADGTVSVYPIASSTPATYLYLDSIRFSVTP
jgi:hypothetical protein